MVVSTLWEIIERMTSATKKSLLIASEKGDVGHWFTGWVGHSFGTRTVSDLTEWGATDSFIPNPWIHKNEWWIAGGINMTEYVIGGLVLLGVIYWDSQKRKIRVKRIK